MRMCRDGVLQSLVSIGSLESVETLRGLVRELPSQPWLRTQLFIAEDLMRGSTWIPLRVEEVLRVCDTPNGKFIDNEKTLCSVLQDVLTDYEKELHGEQNLAQFLRSPQGSPRNKIFGPKDEGGDFRSHPGKPKE